MKNLIFINGTMGVGKTVTSKELQRILPKCVFLDGDWCWDMNPFIVTGETKQMVEDNIRYILNNFLRCSEFENIIFCWVMHKQKIIKSILSGLNIQDTIVHKFSLTCSEQALKERFTQDVEKGLRLREVISESISRLKNYDLMDTIKIDVSDINPKQASHQIKNLMGC